MPAQYVSEILTEREREAARDEVALQYDFTTARGAAVAAQQLRELDAKVAPIEAAFAEGVTPEDRAVLLGEVLADDLDADERETLARAGRRALGRRARRVRARAGHHRAVRAPRHRGRDDA